MHPMYITSHNFRLDSTAVMLSCELLPSLKSIIIVTWLNSSIKIIVGHEEGLNILGKVSKHTAVDYCERRHLISAPVPRGRYRQTEEYARPRQVRIVNGTEKVQRVWRWNAATMQFRVFASHSMADCCVRDGVQELICHRFEALHLQKTCNFSSVFLPVCKHRSSELQQCCWINKIIRGE